MFKLSVNTTKTNKKNSRGKVRRIPTFYNGWDVFEVVSDYVHLGITMIYNNKFDKAIRKQLNLGGGGAQPQDMLEIIYQKLIKKILTSETIHSQLHVLW